VQLDRAFDVIAEFFDDLAFNPPPAEKAAHCRE
jgi:hypothetical protein